MTYRLASPFALEIVAHCLPEILTGDHERLAGILHGAIGVFQSIPGLPRVDHLAITVEAGFVGQNLGGGVVQGLGFSNLSAEGA